MTASMAGSVPTERMSIYKSWKVRKNNSACKKPYVLATLHQKPALKIKRCCLTCELNLFVIKSHVQVGLLPLGCTEKRTEAVGNGCREDEHVASPSWFKPLHMVMCLAPEVVKVN